MQRYFDFWRAYTKRKVINELLYVENDKKSIEIYNLISPEVKNKLDDLNNYLFAPFDFGFEYYSDSYKLTDDFKKLSQGRFLIPKNGKYYYCDCYNDDNLEEASEEQKNNFPILPPDWEEAHYKASKTRFGIKKMVAERKILDRKDKSSIFSLCVFDFDGTLFKSPEKPDSEGNSWWLFAKSLDMPATPHVPGNEWWYNKTVDLALEKIKDPNTYCIMLTGRSERFLEKRINELLLQKKMLFDEVGLNDSGEESENFKIARINEIIKSLPKLQKLEMWEDQKDLANKYSEEFSNKPYKFVIHIIDDSYSKSNKKNIKLKIKINV